MKMAELSSLAFGRWEGILLGFGANASSLKGINKPCPFCGGRDRYSWYDEGVGKWYCRQCGHGDGFDFLNRLNGWDLKKAIAEVEAIVGTVPVAQPKAIDPEAKTAYMRRVWSEAQTITPTDPAGIYLLRRCGFIPACADLRYHPALKHTLGGKHPAMVARMRSQDGKRATGLHRTYLDQSGNKAQVEPSKMSLGEIGTIRLAEAGMALGIAEGIETALCASKLFGIPVWAAVCANGMESWTPPNGVESVVIFGDNDESFTGQAAAWSLAKHLRTLGVSVQVRIPERVGTDWADQINPVAA